MRDALSKCCDDESAGATLSVAHSVEREREFWDQHVPTLEACLREYASDPDPNTRRMLEAAEPLAGRRVLDLGCGTGVTSVRLASRGAVVTGLDVSPASIERARQLAAHNDAAVEFIVAELGPTTFAPESFDVVAGRYILHHLNLETMAPVLDHILAPSGLGVFVETVGRSMLLRACRRALAGRAGIARYGTDDESPISERDLDVLRRTFGGVTLETAQMQFLRILDRNVLRCRWALLSTPLNAGDDAMLRFGLGAWSYHQVIVMHKTGQSHRTV